MRIIIVEDEAVTRKWVRKKIEELDIDYHVMAEFANGKQALEYCKEHEVDVVFTDIRMAVMDGLEFLDQLRTTVNVQPYKVILSAYDEFHYARHAMKVGAQEFVLKPEITKEGMIKIFEEARCFLEKSRIAAKQTETETVLGRQQSIMQRLLEPNTSENQIELIHEMERCGKPLKEKNLILVSISLPGGKDCNAVLEVAELLLQEEHINGICLTLEEGECTLVYNENIRLNRETFAEKLQVILRTNLGTEPFIGISMKKDGFLQLRDLLRQARTSRENRIFFDIPGIQLYDSMSVSSYMEYGDFYYAKEIKEILTAINNCSFAKAEEGIEAFLEDAREKNMLPPAYVKALCIEILSAYIQNVRRDVLTQSEEEVVRQTELMFSDRFATLKILQGWMISRISLLREICEVKCSLRQYSIHVQKIITYVTQNYMQKISLEEVSCLVHMNKSYVSVLFKKETGQKFSDFLLRVRLEKSCWLLETTKDSIQEIAALTGFPDAAYFSRAFKERYGNTPLEYRRKTKK